MMDLYSTLTVLIVFLFRIGFGDICPGSMTLLGKAFLVGYVLCGLAMFGGVLEVSAAWHSSVPGGAMALLVVVIGLGSTLFIALEGLSQTEAIYASIVTGKMVVAQSSITVMPLLIFHIFFCAGTTIGYGDKTPSTDLGKLAVALYAVLVVNVMAVVLAPGRAYFDQFCRVPIPDEIHIDKGVDKKKDQ